ncbi:DOMON-like domain-containing protein [Synechococcus sp. BIOS-E4-1]|uniref:DOMON-like domain-containing protein n=1 Tax=Synechococcus sp. BIOS-E4-1 TaxID=1400864 RepID=UPI00164693AF|nr:DOMON-like domain-containing protein [Synechococcus sp. BIOS-E4-1]
MGRHPVMVRQVCPLIPFDFDQCPAVLAMAEFVWKENAPLELSFSLSPKLNTSSIDCLALNTGKTHTSAQRLDNLWSHTCFEAFLARPGAKGYWEMNVSPNGDWNLYQFSDYRMGGMADPLAKAPVVNFSMDRVGCLCTIQIPLKPWWQHTEIPEIALTMVLEDQSGCLSYWALNHPRDKPDFHDRRGFLCW